MAGLTFITLAAVFLNQSSLDDVERRLGPFTIAGEAFHVVLHEKHVTGSPDSAGFRTLALLEIQDGFGNLAYQKSFSYQLDSGKFKAVTSASATLLPGNGLAGLLVRYTTAPATPGIHEYWQLFRLINNRLAPFELEANIQPTLTGAALATNRGRLGLSKSSDVTTIRVWTGNFYVLVPVRIDWQHGLVTSGERCFEMAGNSGMVETGCEMAIEAESNPTNADFSFIRLFVEANEKMGTARHVVLKKDSKAQFIAAKAIVKFSVREDLLEINFSDLWLKVLIDNNDENLGWIHSDEDFSAVGLPARNVSQ